MPHASQALTTVNYANSSLIVREGARTSSLPAPEMTLTGHEGAVYSVVFDPEGGHLATAGMDRGIFLWDVAAMKNSNVLAGHKSAVLQLRWADSGRLLSCSADRTAALWDVPRGCRLRRFSGHTAIVNAVDGRGDLLVSGSDDCSAIVWDARAPRPAASAFLDYQLLAVALAANGQQLYTGGLDGVVRRFDLRGDLTVPDLVLDGPADSITGLSLNRDDSALLVNAMDSTVRVYDVRPFTPSGVSRARAVCRVHHGAEKLLLRCGWSTADGGECFAAGSADRLVHLFGSDGRERGAWAGHRASVNEVAFHPSQPVLASCSSDKTVTLGEYTP